MKRIHTCFSIVILLTVLIWRAAPSAAQDESYKVFFPFLVEVKGWNAEDPEGVSMDMGSFKMLTAIREYNQEKAGIKAVVMIGNQMMMNNQSKFSVSSKDMEAKTTTIDGFKVYQGFEKEENGGVVAVFLAQKESSQGMLIFNYEQISKEAALTFAKKFDWKKIKKEVEKHL